MKRILRHPAFTLSSGMILANLLSILTVPLLTRLYPAASFGRLAVYFALSSIVGTFSTLRFELALPLIKDDDDAGALTATTLLLTVLGSSVLGGLIFALPISFFGDEARPGIEFIALTILGAVLTGTSQILTQVNVRGNRLNLLSVRHITEKSVVAATAVTLAGVGAAERGLIIAQSIGLILSVAMLAYGHLGLLRRGFAFGLARGRALAREYRDFPLKNLGSVGSQLLANQLPTLLLSSHFGPVALGFLNIAQRLTDAPTPIVGSSLAVVNYRHLIALEPPARRPWFRKTLAWSLLGALPPTLLVAYFAPVIVPRLVGAQWIQSTPYLIALLPVGVMRLVFLLQQPALLVSRRLHVELACSVALLIGTLACLGGGLYLGLDLWRIVLSYSVVNASIYALTVLAIDRGL